MSKTMSAADAKTHFAEALRTVEGGGSVVITRYGRPVAVMVDPSDLARLESLRAAGPQAGLGGLVGSFDDGDEFADAVERVVEARRSRQSSVERE